MYWLAEKTHEFAIQNLGVYSMGRAGDLMYKAFLQIEGDGELILDKDFIMHIFLPLYGALPEFEAYLTFNSDEKESFPIGSLQPENHVHAVDEAKGQTVILPNMCQELTDPGILCDTGCQGSWMCNPIMQQSHKSVA